MYNLDLLYLHYAAENTEAREKVQNPNKGRRKENKIAESLLELVSCVILYICMHLDILVSSLPPSTYLSVYISIFSVICLSDYMFVLLLLYRYPCLHNLVVCNTDVVLNALAFNDCVGTNARYVFSALSLNILCVYGPRNNSVMYGRQLCFCCMCVPCLRVR